MACGGEIVDEGNSGERGNVPVTYKQIDDSTSRDNATRET